ncbi:MAG: methyltransferase domain-containing protein [bacterium]|nr:methyltransferase domain-containing protein [bacterium]
MGSAETQGELWGKGARDWSELQEPMHTPLFEAMLDAGKVGAGSRVLDIGCGSGGASVLAAQRGASVQGLDAAESLLEVARHRVPTAEFRVGEMQELSFSDSSVDAVIAANSIQYSADRIAAVSEMKRVCEAGGRIVLGLWAAPERVEFRAVFKAMKDVLPEPPPGKGPFELSAPGVLAGLLQEAGLHVVRTGEAQCPFVYPSFDVFWRANMSAGPAQAVMRQVPAEQLAIAMEAAVEPFKKADGSIVFNNSFQYAAAQA